MFKEVTFSWSRCLSIRIFFRSKHSASSKRWLQRQEKDLYSRRAREDGIPSRAYYKLQEIDSGSSLNKKRRRRTEGELRIFSRGQTVVELGAAPGGWSLYAAHRIGGDGTLLALDLLPLDTKVLQKLQGLGKKEERRLGANPIATTPYFNFFQGDFRTEEAKLFIINALMQITPEKDNAPLRDENKAHSVGVDVVMSDMAANFTGDGNTDALRTMALCEEALLFAVGSDHCFGPQSYHETSALWKERGVLKQGGSFLCKYFTSGPEVEGELMEVMKRSFEKIKVLKPEASRKGSAEKFVLGTRFKPNI